MDGKISDGPRFTSQTTQHTSSEDISPELDIETILSIIGYAEFSRIREAQNIALNLSGTDLRRADLYGAKLTGTYLRDSDLRDADLRNADLTHSYLWGADLRDADLGNTDLTDTDLTNAFLTNAFLTNADLTNADLRNTDLTNAALEEVRGLTQTQIERTIGNEKTPLPEGLIRPTTWTQVVEAPHDKMPENE